MRMTLNNKDTKCKNVQEAFNEFIFIKKNDNSSEDTIRDYKNIFGIFIEFVGKDFLCKNINADVVEEYIAYLRTKPKKNSSKHTKDKEIEYLSSVSIASYIRHLRAVLNKFMERGYTEPFKVKIPVYNKDVKDVYTPEELERLLRKPNLKKCSFSEYRNWVITNYLLATANRISTIINLKIKDINFSENEIYLAKVKNRKSYTIPLQKDLKRVLLEYLSYRQGEPEDYLFCSENDNKKGLSREGFKTAIFRYNTNRQVAKTSAHVYRNTFAKYWILQGGDLIRLQKILGHKDLKMVLEYVEMYGADLQVNFNSYNPLSSYAKGEHISLK